MNRKNQVLNRLSIPVFFSICTAAHAFSDLDCRRLERNIFDPSNFPSEAAITAIESAATKGDLCARNLSGRMFAEGRGAPSDWERAYTIFSELANSNYPPAQLNLAILISDKSDLDIPAFISYLTGLIVSNWKIPKYAYIAKSARELGMYALQYRINSDSESEDKKILYSQILRDFEDAVADSAVRTNTEILAKERAGKEREQTILGIIYLGAALYSARASMAYGGGSNLVTSPAWMNYGGIIGPSSMYRAPAWGTYNGIIGPSILYKLR
jgi:TPR repeat protein